MANMTQVTMAMVEKSGMMRSFKFLMMITAVVLRIATDTLMAFQRQQTAMKYNTANP